MNTLSFDCFIEVESNGVFLYSTTSYANDSDNKVIAEIDALIDYDTEKADDFSYYPQENIIITDEQKAAFEQLVNDNIRQAVEKYSYDDIDNYYFKVII